MEKSAYLTEELKWISKEELFKQIQTNPADFVEAMKEWVKLLAEK